jgi:hypothetical protein
MLGKYALGIGLAAVIVTGLAAPAQAVGVPNRLIEQGRLLKKNGNPVTGTVTVKFAIYDALTGGNVLWTETQSVTLDSGYFSAELGDTTSLPANLFGGAQRYIGITVGTDPEMTPRQTIDSAPYAIMAGNVNGDITPNSIAINGATVVDSTGKWVGSSAGLAGPAGPQGPAGPPGMPGPSGVLAVAPVSGFAQDVSFTGGQGAFFLGPTASVTIAAGQAIQGVVTSTVQSPGGFPFRSGQLCYQGSSDSTPTVRGEFIFQAVPGNDAYVSTAIATRMVGLQPGTYTVGYCEDPGFSGSYDSVGVSGWFEVTN